MDVGIKDREEESTWTGTHSRSKIKPSLHCVAGVALLGQFQRRALDGARLADWQQAHEFDPSDTRETRLAHSWPRLSAGLQLASADFTVLILLARDLFLRWCPTV